MIYKNNLSENKIFWYTYPVKVFNWPMWKQYADKLQNFRMIYSQQTAYGSSNSLSARFIIKLESTLYIIVQDVLRITNLLIFSIWIFSLSPEAKISVSLPESLKSPFHDKSFCENSQGIYFWNEFSKLSLIYRSWTEKVAKNYFWKY